MTFDENGICVLESITSPDECDAYVEFLRQEEARHHNAYEDALISIDSCEFIANAGGHPLYHKAVAAFYDSAATRHQADLKAITKRLKQIAAHKAKLEGK